MMMLIEVKIISKFLSNTRLFSVDTKSNCTKDDQHAKRSKFSRIFKLGKQKSKFYEDFFEPNDPKPQLSSNLEVK